MLVCFLNACFCTKLFLMLLIFLETMERRSNVQNFVFFMKKSVFITLTKNFFFVSEFMFIIRIKGVYLSLNYPHKTYHGILKRPVFIVPPLVMFKWTSLMCALKLNIYYNTGR